MARVDRGGRPVLARPCPRCQLALARAGILRAHYTTDHAGIETLIIPAMAVVGRPGRGGFTVRT